MKIRVTRETLSDGSHVFNVYVPEMRIAADSEGNAQRAADAIADAINTYDVHNDADVVFTY